MIITKKLEASKTVACVLPNDIDGHKKGESILLDISGVVVFNDKLGMVNGASVDGYFVFALDGEPYAAPISKSPRDISILKPDSERVNLKVTSQEDMKGFVSFGRVVGVADDLAAVRCLH